MRAPVAWAIMPFPLLHRNSALECGVQLLVDPLDVGGRLLLQDGDGGDVGEAS